MPFTTPIDWSAGVLGTFADQVDEQQVGESAADVHTQSI